MARDPETQRFVAQNRKARHNYFIEDTIEAFTKIADGEYDHVAEQAFFMCGGLDDVERQWAEIQKNL